MVIVSIYNYVSSKRYINTCMHLSYMHAPFIHACTFHTCMHLSYMHAAWICCNLPWAQEDQSSETSARCSSYHLQVDKAHHVSLFCVSHWHPSDDCLGLCEWHSSIHLLLGVQSCCSHHRILDCCYTTTFHHAFGEYYQTTGGCGSSLPQQYPYQRSRRKTICEKCLKTPKSYHYKNCFKYS